MALTGPEPIIAAVVARLENDLPAVIDAVNAEVTDGITIDYPVAIFDFAPPPALITGTPVLGVVEGRYHLEDDTGWGATGRVPITIVSYVQSVDPAVLAKQLRRLDRAVIQCILKGRSLPPDGWGVTFVHTDPGPTLGRNENPREYLSLRASTIDVRFEQDTP